MIVTTAFIIKVTPRDGDNDGGNDYKDGHGGLKHPPKENGMHIKPVYVPIYVHITLTIFDYLHMYI